MPYNCVADSFAFLSHSLGLKDKMHSVHPRLIGKRVVHFPLVLIKLFPLVVTVKALRANID